MSEAEARVDACHDYKSSLEDLTFNSKPHINMLTILAEENVQFAKDIVTVIEAQIAKAPTSEKLPVMYLMDSIVKNIGKDYLEAFAKKLVATFVNVFEKVDENTRKSLYKLRSTWDEIFPSKKLFALDVRVNAIDTAWPIKPLPANVGTASIHVNPKFLNKSEESPPPPVSAPAPAPPRSSTADVPKPLSQEHMIRQQLLAKQRQLIELQQKKLELELEQTKAQLASASLPLKLLHTATPEIRVPPARVPPPPSHPEKSKVSPASHPHEKPPDKSQIPTRDPRLSRQGPHVPQAKDQGHKKDPRPNTLASADGKHLSSDKTAAAKVEKAKPNEKPHKPPQSDLKVKSKAPSPLKLKLPHSKEKSQTPETVRDVEQTRKDPRLRKHLRDKAEEKQDEVKDKKKFTEKRDEHKSTDHRPSGNRNKLVNGISSKSEASVIDSDKGAAKSGRLSSRKRSHSPKTRSPVRSPKSRSPIHSPKRRDRERDRRSPKRRQRSLSPPIPAIPPLLKINKPRPAGIKPSHGNDFPSSTREERGKRIPKIDARDSRRLKKTSEERQKDPLSPAATKSSSEPKENVENWQGLKTGKRWKSTWEENKNLQNEEHHQGNRTPYPRHRDSWQNSNKSITSPRTQKQTWLSVDADLKIPKELTNASKAELLKKAHERLTSGEITQDEFLVVAHQIRQLFQYQDERRRSNSWDSPTDENKGGLRKKPLLSNTELTYYEHKARLKRTQVQHSFPGSDLMDSEFLDYPLMDMVHPGRECEHGGRIPPVESKRDQFSETQRGLSPILSLRPHEEELSLDGHRILEDERVLSQGLSEEPLPPFNEQFNKRPRFEDCEQTPFGDGTESRMIGNETQHGLLLDDRRPVLDAPLRLSGPLLDLPAGKGFEEPPNIPSMRGNSPPNACVRFDGMPGNQLGSQHFEPMQVDVPFEPIVNKPMDGPRFDGMSGQPVNLQAQPVSMPRFEGQAQMVSSVQPMGPQRLEGPQGQPLGAQRFEGAPGQPMGQQRFEGIQPMGPQRFENTVGRERFDGSPRPPLLQPRFDGSQCQPMRFEQPVGQPIRFDANAGQPLGSMRFEGPHGPRFELNQPPRFDHGPVPQPIVRFDAGPRFDGAPRFEAAPRFDAGPRFDGTPRFEAAPRFDAGPRFDGAPRFEGAPRFNAGPRFDVPQRFEGVPVNRFEGQPPHLGRFDVLHGQRFEGPPGHQTPPRFDGPLQMQPMFDRPMPQRFETPNPQVRFDMPMGHQGPPRFENVAPPPPVRQNVPPFGQNGPYPEPQNMFQGPPQGMQFQRPEQRFELPAPNLAGPPCFPNQNLRPPGPYFEEKNQQGPPFGNFNNLPVGNIQANQQFPPQGAMVQPAPFNPEQAFVPQPQGPNPNVGVFVNNNQPAGSLAYPENHLGQLDVNELFSKLLSTGILKAAQRETPPSQESTSETTETEAASQAPVEEEEDEPMEAQDIPDLKSFSMEDLKHRYDSVITQLYSGIQCYSCGMRFTKFQTDVYADHLDWHYRQNRTEKDVNRKITHRRWYYNVQDWIEFEEIADLEERAKSQFFEKVHEEVIMKTQEAAKEKEFQSVVAGPAGSDEICEICEEQFEQYWDEEEEEWHLKNAMRFNDKIYHPSCYEDYKNTSSFLDCTPSPSKTLLENPLSAVLNLVKEEAMDSSKVEVKQEQTDTTATSCSEAIPLLTDIKTEPREQE